MLHMCLCLCHSFIAKRVEDERGQGERTENRGEGRGER